MMFNLIAFVLATGILVFIHEFGHYYVAKTFGVKVEEFAVGFGKVIYSRIDKAGMLWTIRVIPLGGFVKMYGESAPASGAAEYNSEAFYSKPLYARFLTVLAGPLANYLVAIIILAGFYFTFGKMEMPAIIAEVVQNSPAEVAGLRSGDKVITADNAAIGEFKDLQNLIILNTGKPINLTINRAGEIIKVSVIPAERPKQDDMPAVKTGYIGIIAKAEPLYLKVGIFASIYQSVNDVIDISLLTLKAVKQMIVGERSITEVYGPLTIAKQSGRAMQQGYLDFALFVAMLSINLGLLNLLPIPVLDGGHLLFMLYELVARKKLSSAIQQFLLGLGVVIMLFLVVISTSNDIRSLWF